MSHVCTLLMGYVGARWVTFMVGVSTLIVTVLQIAMVSVPCHLPMHLRCGRKRLLLLASFV